MTKKSSPWVEAEKFISSRPFPGFTRSFLNEIKIHLIGMGLMKPDETITIIERDPEDPEKLSNFVTRTLGKQMSHETLNPFDESPAEQLVRILDPSDTKPLENFLAGFFAKAARSYPDRDIRFVLAYREEGVQFTVSLKAHTFHRIVHICEIRNGIQPEKFGGYLCGQMVEAVIQSAREAAHD